MGAVWYFIDSPIVTLRFLPCLVDLTMPRKVAYSVDAELGDTVHLDADGSMVITRPVEFSQHGRPGTIPVVMNYVETDNIGTVAMSVVLHDGYPWQIWCDRKLHPDQQDGKMRIRLHGERFRVDVENKVDIEYLVHSLVEPDPMGVWGENNDHYNALSDRLRQDDDFLKRMVAFVQGPIKFGLVLPFRVHQRLVADTMRAPKTP